MKQILKLLIIGLAAGLIGCAQIANNEVPETESAIETESISEEEKLSKETVAVKMDDAVWINGRVIGNTGDMSGGKNTTIVRTAIIPDYINRITAPIECLSAFLYQKDGTYIGAWEEETESLVKAAYDFSKMTSIDFERIREQYPDANIKIQASSEIIGENAKYANMYFRVEYDKQAAAVLEQGPDYETIPLNFGDWWQGEYRYEDGKLGFSKTRIAMIEDVPDYWCSVTAKKIMQVAAYDVDNEYMGTWTPKGLVKIRAEGAIYASSVNFELLREQYPEYSFKLTMYNTGHTDISNLGTVVINRTKYNQENPDKPTMEVPTRFTREVFYNEDLNSVGDRVSTQGFCTDGEYLYIAALQSADNDGEGSVTYLRKIDLEGNLVAGSEVNIGHANSMAYDPTNNVIIVVGSYGKDYTKMRKVNPETLEVVETVDMTELIARINAESGKQYKGIYRVAYYAQDNTFVICVGNAYVVVDTTFTEVKKIIPFELQNGMLGQFIYPTSDYIMAAYAGTRPYDVMVCDWDGNTLCGFNVPYGYGSGYDELEGLCVVDGVWYMAWNVTGSVIRITKGVQIGSRFV